MSQPDHPECRECNNPDDLVACVLCGALVCPDHAREDWSGDFCWCQPCAQQQDVAAEQEFGRLQQESREDMALNLRLAQVAGYTQPDTLRADIDRILVAMVERRIVADGKGGAYVMALSRLAMPNGPFDSDEAIFATVIAEPRLRAQALIQVLSNTTAQVTP